MVIDKYKRYQKQLKMIDLYPKRYNKKCDCECILIDRKRR